MTNLTFNSEIAKQVLTTEELIILKTLFNKVKNAEVETRKNECDCMDCTMEESMKELKQALSSTSEEVTPELINHLLTSILKSKGINAEIVGFAEVSEKEEEEEIKEEPQSKLEKELEELLESGPLAFLGLMAALAKVAK